MKIKVVVIDNDLLYTKRLINACNEFYPSEMEIYAFESILEAENNLSKKSADVLVIDEMSAEASLTDEMPIKAKSRAVFTSIKNIDEIKGLPAICKYQKIDFLYRKFIEVLSENSTLVMDKSSSNTDIKIEVFCSAVGGTGVSTLACAYAINKSTEKNRVLYLEMGLFGSTDYFFSDDGESGMSDVAYSIIGKKKNLNVKIKALTKKDDCGVFFFSQSKNAPDMLEMTFENKKELLDILRLSGDYDCIVIDLPADLSDFMKYCLQISDEVFIVADGTDLVNRKTQRLIEALEIIDEVDETECLAKCKLIYNKCSASAKKIENPKVKLAGTVSLNTSERKLKDISAGIMSQPLWKNIE